jgi:hypothetical protein
MNTLEPDGNVYSFDAWHAAMEGPQAHEQMRQRRLNAAVDAQIERAVAAPELSFFGVAREIARGPFTIDPQGFHEPADFR